MASVHLPPGDTQYYLQRALVQQFRQSRRYTNHVEKDLRPLWSKVAGTHPDFARRGSRPLFGNLESLADDELLEQEEAGQTGDMYLPEYRERIHDTVARVMGLYRSGEPAEWAFQYVHADVSVDPKTGFIP